MGVRLAERSKSKPSNQASADSGRRTANIWSAIICFLQGKAWETTPVEKFPQEIYNEEYTLHCNRRRSESSMALEEEE